LTTGLTWRQRKRCHLRVFRKEPCATGRVNDIEGLQVVRSVQSPQLREVTLGRAV